MEVFGKGVFKVGTERVCIFSAGPCTMHTKHCTAQTGFTGLVSVSRRAATFSIIHHYSFLQGIGRNYRIAKCTAAKCALKALKKLDSKDRRRK